MSIDAAESRRQKKWKFIIVLLLLSSLSLGAAIGILKKELVLSSFPAGDGTVSWSQVAAGRDVQTATTDSGVYLLSKGRLTNLKQSGMTGAYPGDTMLGGFCLALYETFQREIYFPETGEQVALPGRILSLSVGREKYLSAILSASGYRTKTVIFTETGEIIGEIPLGDKTMVETAFFMEDSVLAALCLSESGHWEVLLYAPEGELFHTEELDAGVCYELLAMKEYVAIRTDKGVCVISAEGELVSTIMGSIDRLAVSDHYIACISENTLKTYTPDGVLLGEAVLSYYPGSISVSGNRIYIHFGEGLGCYSPQGDVLWFRKEGSMAIALETTKKGCILIPFLVAS